MTTQPDALRLAEYHECAEDLHSIQTAAELRRLAEVEGEWMALSQDQGKLEGQIDRLVAQRDALLAVVNKLEYSSDGYIKRYPEESEVSAAIKQAEGENT